MLIYKYRAVSEDRSRTVNKPLNLRWVKWATYNPMHWSNISRSQFFVCSNVQSILNHSFKTNTQKLCPRNLITFPLTAWNSSSLQSSNFASPKSVIFTWFGLWTRNPEKFIIQQYPRNFWFLKILYSSNPKVWYKLLNLYMKVIY